VEQFKHLETTLTNQNSIHEEIKSRMKSGNPCYHRVQNRLSSSLLSKKVNINLACCLLFYGGVQPGHSLREEHRLRVFEKRLLRKVCEPKRDEITGDWKRVHKKKFYALCSSPNINQMIK
jgi:hypothetical protein